MKKIKICLESMMNKSKLLGFCRNSKIRHCEQSEAIHCYTGLLRFARNDEFRKVTSILKGLQYISIILTFLIIISFSTTSFAIETIRDRIIEISKNSNKTATKNNQKKSKAKTNKTKADKESLSTKEARQEILIEIDRKLDDRFVNLENKLRIEAIQNKNKIEDVFGQELVKYKTYKKQINAQEIENQKLLAEIKTNLSGFDKTKNDLIKQNKFIRISVILCFVIILILLFLLWKIWQKYNELADLLRLSQKPSIDREMVRRRPIVPEVKP